MRMYDPKPHKPTDNDLLKAAGTLAQYARYMNAEAGTFRAETELALYVQRSLLTLAGADAELFTVDVDQILRDRQYHPTVALTVLDQIEEDEAVAAVLGSYIMQRFDRDIDLMDGDDDTDAGTASGLRPDRCSSLARDYFEEGDWHTEQESEPLPDPDDWMGPDAAETAPESPMERANVGRIVWSDPPSQPIQPGYEAVPHDEAVEKNRMYIRRARRDPTINTGHLIW